MSWCPFCEADAVVSDSFVTDTRILVNGWMHRRRRCKLNNQHRWVTYEIPGMELDLSEHDQDGLKERRRP